MTEKIDRIILTNFVIGYNHSKVYSNISRTSSERIEKNMSLLKSLLITRISIVVNLNFIV